MTPLLPAAWWAGILIVASLGVAAVFLLYPLAVAAGAVLCRRPAEAGEAAGAEELPSVSFVIVARNAGQLMQAKLENTCAIDYPGSLCEIVVFSDGSTDATEGIVRAFDDPRVTLLKSDAHEGKINGLNQAAAQCTGDMLVFTDADALLEPDAVARLVSHYRDPQIGGVCGQRVLAHEAAAALAGAQSLYVNVDSALKRLESRVGSITSNDGKLYSIRRSLFRPIRPGTTDDLYTCLSVVRQEMRFVFEPDARVVAPAPSRSPGHEIRRRRRIVCRSMHAIAAHACLFNPLRYGLYGLRLGVNKVLRRMLPVSLLVMLISSAVLWRVHPGFAVLVGLQAAFYLAAAAYAALPGVVRALGPLGKPSRAAFYFCIGNVGMLLGLWDFARGRRIDRWEPEKPPVSQDAEEGSNR